LADYVVAGLVRRRAELAGEVEALKARVAALVADMRQIDAVIRQFDPGHDLSSIRPKRRLRAADSAGRGEVARFVLAALRGAPGPLTAADLARRLLASRGAGAAEGAVPRAAARRMAMALRHQELNGAVAATREPGRPVLWEIVR
jgi:hypothetical protein